MAAPQLTSPASKASSRARVVNRAITSRDSRINSRTGMVSTAVNRQSKLQVRAEQTANYKQSPANLLRIARIDWTRATAQIEEDSMKKILCVAAFTLLAGTATFAQQPARMSPPEALMTTLPGDGVTITPRASAKHRSQTATDR
jgi:hypothetical protein